MKTTVCTACYFPTTGPIRPLAASCKRFGVDLQIFGLGRVHKHYVDTKVVGLAEFLKTVTTPWVLYVDGTDVLWQDGLEAMERTCARILREQNKQYLIGSECKLWPRLGYEELFVVQAEPFAGGSEFIYHAPGMIMGETTAIRDALLRLAEFNYTQEPVHDKQRGDDMWCWQEGIARGIVDPAIDYRCEMSLSMLHVGNARMAVADDRAVFADTGTVPHMLHFNGMNRRAQKRKFYYFLRKLGYGEVFAPRTRCEWLTRLRKGMVGAEVGVLLGQFSQQILEIAQPALLYGVDHWDCYLPGPAGDIRRAQQAHRYDIAMERLAPYIDRGQYKVLRGKSVEIAEQMADASLDFVYIDAHHTKAAVREDLEAWYPKVRKRGIIAGHDYNPKSHPHKVCEAVTEFRAKYNVKNDLCVTSEWPGTFWFRR